MFRRLAPLALVLLAAPLPAAAQQLIRIPTCGTASAPPTGPGYMDATGNQCSSATLSGGTITANTKATAAASPPSYSPGDQNLSQNLSGGLRMQPSLGGTDMTLGQKTMSASLPVVIASDQTAVLVSSTAKAVTTAAGTASAIVTGGTAVTLVTGPVNGCYIVNPINATEQNIAAAEVAYINPVTTATANGRGTNSRLELGQGWSCPPGMTGNVSAIAATTAHAFNVVVW